jgi:hypothetical protein
MSDGIDANTFTSTSGNSRVDSRVDSSPKLISGSRVLNKINTNPILENATITVYQTTEFKEIWNNNANASTNVSIWRSQGPAGMFSVGDIAIGEYRKPTTGFVVKTLTNDALKSAESWRLVWNNRGSGDNWNGAIWQPICPYNYQGIGYVATGTHSETPSVDAFRCIKAEYLVDGSWNLVWKNQETESLVNVGIWKATPSEGGQGLNTFSAIDNHGDMDIPAYVLNSSVVNYVAGKQAIKYAIQNVVYIFEDLSIDFTEPKILGRITVENNVNTSQTIWREFAYMYDESSTWSMSRNLELGVVTTVNSVTPFLLKGNVSVHKSGCSIKIYIIHI